MESKVGVLTSLSYSPAYLNRQRTAEKRFGLVECGFIPAHSDFGKFLANGFKDWMSGLTHRFMVGPS